MWDLLDGLPEVIGGLFTDFFVSLDDILVLAQSQPNSQIQGFPSMTLWNAATNISSSIGTGIAATIISLFLFFELASIFNRADTKGWDGIYWILMVVLKVSVCIAIAKNMSLIINICFEISGSILNSIRNSEWYSLQGIQTADIANSLQEYYTDQSTPQCLLGYCVALVVYMLNNLCMIVVKIVCQLRFIEIYIFTAVAPLPFCTFCNHEYKHIGVAFIKRMLALGLQGVFISVVCIFYTVIVNASIGDAVVEGNPTSTMFKMLAYSILLLISIFQTGGWSKSLLQVN